MLSPFNASNMWCITRTPINLCSELLCRITHCIKQFQGLIKKRKPLHICLKSFFCCKGLEIHRHDPQPHSTFDYCSQPKKEILLQCHVRSSQPKLEHKTFEDAIHIITRHNLISFNIKNNKQMI